MPKQTFGGDDDTEYTEEEEKKKLKLSKFELEPDYNVRDLFWKILASYAATKSPGKDLSKIKEQRIPLEKSAISVLESRRSHFYGLSPQFVARYALMMFVDGGWGDAFIDFLCDTRQSKVESWKYVVQALKNLLAMEKYRIKITEYFSTEIRNSKLYPCILFYLPKLKDKKLVEKVRRETSIYAKGEMEENQMNAIDAIALLDDEEVKGIMLNLLRHWDVKVRKKVAEKLKSMKLAAKDIELIKRRIEVEPDKDIKNILNRKVKTWKKR